MNWLFLCMVIGATSALECGICMHGRCLSPTPLKIGSEDVSAATSAMDFENNILYILKDGLQAIHLDDNTKSIVQTSRPNETPTFLTVDQVSGDVYYSYGASRGSLYKYNPNTHENEYIRQSISKHIWAYNGTLYTAGIAKGLSSIVGSSKKSVDTFKNIKVKNLVFDKSGNLYASTSSKIIKVIPNEPKKDLTALPYGLRNDRNSNVYLIDYNKHLIHKVDLVTEQLTLAGAFGAKYHDYIHYFKFDKYDNVIAKFPNTKRFTYFKDTSERCVISNPDNTPYTSARTDSRRIINLSTPTISTIKQATITSTDSPHFDD